MYSARYAGTGGSREERDGANNEKLLRELASAPEEKRTARFVCAMSLCRPDGSVVCEATGTYEGIIAAALPLLGDAVCQNDIDVKCENDGWA